MISEAAAAAIDAACPPAPFATVTLADILAVSPDTPDALSALQFLSTRPGIAELLSGAGGAFENIDDEIELIEDSGRGRVLSLTTMLSNANDSPFARPAEDIHATVQLLTAEAVRLLVLTTLRQAMRAPDIA